MWRIDCFDAAPEVGLLSNRSPFQALGALNHYAHLTRELSANELARFAARRAYRMARQAMFRRQPQIDDEAVLRAFNVRSVDALVERLRARAGLASCEVSQRESVVAAVRSVPGAEERALERAERALRREFFIYGSVRAFGAGQPIAWSRDSVSGHIYPASPSEEIALLAGGADPKDVWELGRLESLLALAQGAWLDPVRRESFAGEAAAQLGSFLEENPPGIGIHWTCAMEVALRGANLARALLMLADTTAFSDAAFVLEALRGLMAHAAFVEANLEDQGAVPNNHLVADYAGLLVMASLFPELPGANRQVALALRGLEEQMLAQVHPDGMTFEGSVPYHRLSVELFTLAYVHARACGLTFSEPFSARLLEMFRVSSAYCSERGLAPQWGDNDSGRALGLTERAPLEQGYLAGLGAALFGASELKAQGEALPDEAAWLLGAPGKARFEQTEAARAPASRTTLGGLHVLRGADAVVSISAGANGQRGQGGHSHNDKLAFELHLRGEPVIVDPGTGTYSRDALLRNRLRSTAAHSTVQVDGLEQAPLNPARLFALQEHAGARVVSSRFGEAEDRLVAEHRGFAGIVVQRTFILNKALRSLAVIDLLNGGGMHSVVSRLALADAQARLRPPTVEEKARARAAGEGFESVGPLAVELGSSERPHAVVLALSVGGLSLDEAVYSPGYGEWRNGLCVAARMQGRLPTVMGFLILWDR